MHNIELQFCKWVTNISRLNFYGFSAINSELHQACRQNDDYCIGYLIFIYASILAIDENEKTALEIIGLTVKNYLGSLRPIISAVSKLIFEGKEVPGNLKMGLLKMIAQNKD